MIKKGFYIQLKMGKSALKENKHKEAFYYLENAHVLGQHHLTRHTLSHFWMLIWGIKTLNLKESLGQFFRIIATIVFTLIWIPKGNTGGTYISPVKKIPIRKELIKYFIK